MFTRRRFAAAGALSLVGACSATARAAAAADGNGPDRSGRDADLTLILMSDLHSGYGWSSRLLARVRAEAGAATGAVRIVVNGDLFEHNNVVARRGQGVIDLALIRAFAGIAPTLVTIGNHDSDLFDPHLFASRIAQAGALLLSDVTDPCTGALYGTPSQRLLVRGHPVVFAALGTPLLSLYPPEYRALYQVPDPAAYAASRLPTLIGDAALPVVLVHAGFLADRAVLPHLPAPVLLHGAHDHLRFSQTLGRSLHLQSGAWSSAFQVVTVRFTPRGPAMACRDVVIDRQVRPDADLQRLIDQEFLRHLAPADREVLGHLPQALPLDDAALRAAGWVRAASGADMALLSHTTFGDGLPAGPVTRYDLAAFLRFDGGISVGEIPADRRVALLARTNQFDGGTPYARRTGDYLYATGAAAPGAGSVRVAINSYAVATAASRVALLGWDAPGFVAMDGAGTRPTLARIIADGLAAG